MSYILEALKKSEQERERGAVPDIKTVHNTENPAGAASKNNWWWYVLAIVILVNGGIFAVVYLGEDVTGQQDQVTDRDIASTITDDKSQQQATQSKAGEKIAEPAESIITNQTTDKAQESKSTELNKEQQQIPRVVFSKEPLQLDGSVGNVGEPSNTQKQTSNEPSMEAPVQEESAMLVSELPDNVRKQIPSIAFEGHVYSSTVERRSVMINGKKMRQGDVISADLMLKEITPLGAEFEYQGYRFKLNALQDWSYQ